MNKNIKTVFLFLLVFLVILATVYKGQDFAGKPDEISYSDFLNMVEPIEGKKPIGKITSKDGKETSAKQQIIIDRELIEGWYIPENSKDNKPKLFKTNVAQVNDDLVTKLRKSRLSFTAKSTEENKFWSVVSGIIPWLFALGIIWFIMMRQLQASGNKAFTFGKSRAKNECRSKSQSYV